VKSESFSPLRLEA